VPPPRAPRSTRSAFYREAKAGEFSGKFTADDEWKKHVCLTPALFFGRAWLVADLALSVAGRRSGPHGDDEEAPAAAEGRPQAVTVSMCNDDQTSAQDARRRRVPVQYALTLVVMTLARKDFLIFQPTEKLSEYCNSYLAEAVCVLFF
jgi:hypothetical protein